MTRSDGPRERAANAPLTNLAYLDWLCVPVQPPPQAGHTTYRLDREPAFAMPWTYAEREPDGEYRRVGGGAYDPATGHYGQGAFNADDVARAAVVYLRHWRATRGRRSRRSAYEILRGLAYLQTDSGPNAGNVVLWMQSDGTLVHSADPPELPDPSDSAESFWLARTVWAFGEGYAAFRTADPRFAAFLRARLGLALAAVERQSLVRYGQWRRVDGAAVPAWLIADSAAATGEALIGLAAYVEATGDAYARTVLDRLADGVAAMGGGPPCVWPYGAVLPDARTRSRWHGWAGLAPAGLARAYAISGDAAVRAAVLADVASFTPHLLIAAGPENEWRPAGPADHTQIAYGAQSRIESLLCAAEHTDRPGLVALAGIAASWFFGNNPDGKPVYDPESGRTYDGVDVPGGVHYDSGAESTIHGLLAMLALDAHPEVAAIARVATVHERHTWTEVGGEMVPPPVEWLTLGLHGTGHGTALARSFADGPREARIPVPGAGPVVATAYDPTGLALTRYAGCGADVPVALPPGGFAIAHRVVR